MSVRWLPNPNGAHSHFPRDFRCSYEDLVHYSSKDSRALSRLSRETTLPLECLSLTHQTPPSQNEEWLEGWVVIVKVSKRLAHLKDGTGLAAVKGDANLVGVVIAIATAIGIAMMAELGKTGWALRTSLLADLSSRVSKDRSDSLRRTLAVHRSCTFSNSKVKQTDIRGVQWTPHP